MNPNIAGGSGQTWGNAGHTVVNWTNPDGSLASMLATEPSVAAWLGSNTPAAYVASLAQQAAAALGAGLTITLSGTLTLGATLFPVDMVTQDKLTAIGTTIAVTGGFPGGVTTLPLKDSAGTWHTLNLSQWKAVVAAIASYAAALILIIDGNPLGASSLPAASVSLTV